MSDNWLLLAAEESIWMRLGVGAAGIVFGVIFIFMGLQNIKTKSAEETGKRRLVNQALGQSNTYEGSKAVMMGWIRVIIGVCAILFGIVYMFVGPFLPK